MPHHNLGSDQDGRIQLTATPEQQARLWQLFELGRRVHASPPWELELDKGIEQVLKPRPEFKLPIALPATHWRHILVNMENQGCAMCEDIRSCIAQVLDR